MERLDVKDIVLEDAFGVLCGKWIGGGAYRQVYTCSINDNFVVKVEEREVNNFKNVEEFELYQTALGKKKEQNEPFYEEWLAPCVFLSKNGRILVQYKTKTPDLKNYPEKIPVWLCDAKIQNYGMFKGRLVCHDYGNNFIRDRGFCKKLKKANWWVLGSDHADS